MKNIIKIAAIIIMAFAFNACEKSKDFIADNSTPTGVGYRPVFTNPLRDQATTASINGAKYFANTTFTTELQFWSESPIKEINLYNTIGSGTRTLVSKTPYASAFSQFKRTDTLLVSYTTPTYIIAPIGTKIKLDYEVLNVNSLNVIQSATITIK
ncbi:MAG: hypothetical protein ABIR03_09540 [Ginsengibacter sp.]